MRSATSTRSALTAAFLALMLSLASAAQDTGVLRITIVLVDADGTATPIPRVVLLISDNPATNEPRRLRSDANGAIELSLKPGNYTVESERPVSLGGQAYTWTQMVDVTAGRETTVTLTPKNAEIEAASGASAGDDSMRADSAAIINKWHGSVVEIWTATTHATGFLVSETGLIATDYRAIGDATTVEVEFGAERGAASRERIKIPGRVVASERVQGVSMVWIDAAAVPSRKPVPPGCDTPPTTPVEFEDRIVTIAAPMLAPMDVIQGTVSRVESQLFEADWRLNGGITGGPVFAADGAVIGITIADEEQERRRPDDARVLPLANVCRVLAIAEKKIAGGTPPAGTRLPVEPAFVLNERRTAPDPKAPRPMPTTISSSSFDLALMTPAMVRGEPTMMGPRSDFGNWTEYVVNAPPVLFVRATPQFEESFWKTIARGAAQTQGVALPPLKSFSANFLRLRAYCDNAEVPAIHPFLIERRVQDRPSIREGLYVFALTDFGGCSAVRFDLYSEKSPHKAESRTIDPKLFVQIASLPVQ